MQHRYSTRFAAMLQNKLHVFVARFTMTGNSISTVMLCLLCLLCLSEIELTPPVLETNQAKYFRQKREIIEK